MILNIKNLKISAVIAILSINMVSIANVGPEVILGKWKNNTDEDVNIFQLSLEGEKKKIGYAKPHGYVKWIMESKFKKGARLELSDRLSKGDRPYVTTLIIEDFTEKSAARLTIKTFETGSVWLLNFLNRHGAKLSSLDLVPEGKYLKSGLNLSIEINGEEDFEDSIIDANVVAS